MLPWSGTALFPLSVSLTLFFFLDSHCISHESRSQELVPKSVDRGMCHSLSFFLVISGDIVFSLADVPNINGKEVTSLELNTGDSEQEKALSRELREEAEGEVVVEERLEKLDLLEGFII